MKQFFITALEKDGSTTKNGWLDLGDSYVYGYCQDLKEAKEEIKKHAEEIYNSHYKYICIEQMYPGIHPYCSKQERIWFEYDETTKTYKPKKEVEGFYYSNLALG